jgi:hypothetical protein
VGELVAVREMTDARGDRSNPTGMTAAPVPADGDVRRLSDCMGPSDTDNEGDRDRRMDARVEDKGGDTVMDGLISSFDLGLLELRIVGKGDAAEKDANDGDGARNCSAADGVGVLLPRDD